MYLPQFNLGEFRCKANHYRFEANGQRIVYTYIRKNACSAFKKMLLTRAKSLWMSRIFGGLRKYPGDDLRGIRSFKFYPGKAARDFDHLIFVYRDPFERIVSLYLNKFVENNGAGDIRKSFESACFESADEATFEDFLNYLSGPFEVLDPHCYPQKAHLLDVAYTCPININCLFSEIRKILGDDLSSKFFLAPVNSVQKKGQITEQNFFKNPAKELAAMQKGGIRFTKNNFATLEARNFILSRYWMDYEMIGEIEKISEMRAVRQVGWSRM